MHGAAISPDGVSIQCDRLGPHGGGRRVRVGRGRGRVRRVWRARRFGRLLLRRRRLRVAGRTGMELDAAEDGAGLGAEEHTFASVPAEEACKGLGEGLGGVVGRVPEHAEIVRDAGEACGVAAVEGNHADRCAELLEAGGASERRSAVGLRGALVAHFHNRLLEPAPAGIAIRMKIIMREAMHANAVVECYLSSSPMDLDRAFLADGLSRPAASANLRNDSSLPRAEDWLKTESS